LLPPASEVALRPAQHARVVALAHGQVDDGGHDLVGVGTRGQLAGVQRRLQRRRGGPEAALPEGHRRAHALHRDALEGGEARHRRGGLHAHHGLARAGPRAARSAPPAAGWRLPRAARAPGPPARLQPPAPHPLPGPAGREPHRWPGSSRGRPARPRHAQESQESQEPQKPRASRAPRGPQGQTAQRSGNQGGVWAAHVVSGKGSLEQAAGAGANGRPGVRTRA
jgi:hypothetical protein